MIISAILFDENYHIKILLILKLLLQFEAENDADNPAILFVIYVKFILIDYWLIIDWNELIKDKYINFVTI